MVGKGAFSLSECHYTLSRVLLALFTDAVQVLEKAIILASRGEILRLLTITHGSMVQAEKLTASLCLRLLPDLIEVFFQGLLSLLCVRDFSRMILSLRCHRW